MFDANTVESETSTSATQSPLLPLPPLMPPPRAVRSLTVENQQPELPPQQSPSPGRAASPVIEEALASPMVYCSQFRMEAYERQNEPLHQKVGGWLRAVQAAYASDGPSPYPTPPGTLHKDQYISDSDSEYGRDCPRRRRRRSPPLTRIKNGDLYVHKDYEGRFPLCCYVTRLNEGGPHDFYPCYTKRDTVWARHISYHNEREWN